MLLHMRLLEQPCNDRQKGLVGLVGCKRYSLWTYGHQYGGIVVPYANILTASSSALDREIIETLKTACCVRAGRLVGANHDRVG